MARKTESATREPATVACPACGAGATQGATFCSHCGSQLTSNGSTPQAGAAANGGDSATQPQARKTTLEISWPQLPTQSTQFWQGLAVGLGFAMVVLFVAVLFG